MEEELMIVKNFLGNVLRVGEKSYLCNKYVINL